MIASALRPLLSLMETTSTLHRAPREFFWLSSPLECERGFEPIRIGATVFPPTIAVRSYFSTHFLAAAENAVEAAVQLETAASQVQRFSLAHRGHVLSAIVHSVSFVEGAINEVLQDAAEGRITEKLERVSESAVRSWAALWEALDAGYNGNALNRYQAALIAAAVPLFDKGTEPWQSAHLLVQIRNHLVHFRPETVSQDDPQPLVAKLTSRVRRNPLSSNEWDLDGWLSASCASWAVASARALVEEFATRTGTRPNYQLSLSHLRVNNP